MINVGFVVLNLPKKGEPFGGLDVATRKMIEELRESEIDLDVYVAEERNFSNLEAKELNLDKEESTNLAEDDKKVMKGLASKIEPHLSELDILHVQDWLGLWAARKAKKSENFNGKIITTFHSFYQDKILPGANMGEFFEEVEEELIELSDEVVCVSNDLKTRMEKRFDFNGRVIHNGTEVKIKETNEKERDSFILYVGRLSEQKGLENLIATFKQIENEYDGKLIIAGDGSLRMALEEFAENLGIEKIEFKGYVSEKEKFKLIQASDVFVSPSHNEPFGLTIAEALNCETPVVATRSGIMEVANSGILESDGTPENMARKIFEASEAESFNFENREWSKVSEEYVRLYKEITDEK